MSAPGSFEIAFKLVVGEEGGYSNDRADPGNWTGGAVDQGELRGTKFGISAAAYPLIPNIAGLTIGAAQTIYLRDYWSQMRCDSVGAPVALLLFDAAVLSGPHAAAVRLQRLLAVEPDGVVGDLTIAALKKADLAQIAIDYATQGVLDLVKDAGFDRYGSGWVRRVFEVFHAAIAP